MSLLQEGPVRNGRGQQVLSFAAQTSVVHGQASESPVSAHPPTPGKTWGQSLSSRAVWSRAPESHQLSRATQRPHCSQMPAQDIKRHQRPGGSNHLSSHPTPLLPEQPVCPEYTSVPSPGPSLCNPPPPSAHHPPAQASSGHSGSCLSALNFWSHRSQFPRPLRKQEKPPHPGWIHA